MANDLCPWSKSNAMIIFAAPIGFGKRGKPYAEQLHRVWQSRMQKQLHNCTMIKVCLCPCALCTRTDGIGRKLGNRLGGVYFIALTSRPRGERNMFECSFPLGCSAQTLPINNCDQPNDRSTKLLGRIKVAAR